MNAEERAQWRKDSRPTNYGSAREAILNRRIIQLLDALDCVEAAEAEAARYRDGITALADEWGASVLGTDFFGNAIGGFVPVFRLRALIGMGDEDV